MNRTIKETTTKRFQYESHEQLRVHLADFMAAYNFAGWLKTLSGLTPYALRLTPYEYTAKSGRQSHIGSSSIRSTKRRD